MATARSPHPRSSLPWTLTTRTAAPRCRPADRRIVGGARLEVAEWRVANGDTRPDYSLFAIRYSLFAIRYSLFAIRYSPLVASKPAKPRPPPPPPPRS